MTNRAQVKVYRTRYCPFCVAAERFLQSRDIDFEEVYLDDHPDRHSFTESLMPGHGTVPLILIDDHPIGGYRELLDLDGSGELKKLLTAGADPRRT